MDGKTYIIYIVFSQLYCYLFIFVFLLFFICDRRFPMMNTMGSSTRIQIGALNDRNDEHVAGGVL